jgi:hypothetical protein
MLPHPGWLSHTNLPTSGEAVITDAHLSRVCAHCTFHPSCTLTLRSAVAEKEVQLALQAVARHNPDAAELQAWVQEVQGELLQGSQTCSVEHAHVRSTVLGLWQGVRGWRQQQVMQVKQQSSKHDPNKKPGKLSASGHQLLQVC